MSYFTSTRKLKTCGGPTRRSSSHEILCISANWCTDQQNGVEKTGMPDALALLNVNDVHHLEHLVWAVYDGMLLVGPWPELLGDRPWCTGLAGLHKHIYRGRNDVAHCPPQTLGSWDCQEQMEALRQVGGLCSTWSGQRWASWPQRRSQSGSWHCSQMPARGNRDGHLRGPSPYMPSRSHLGVTTPPCTPLKCYCRAAVSPSISPMPKVASAVNIPSHALSSHSGEGMARASLNEDDAWEDDFQTPHMPVCRVMQRDDDGRRCPAEGRPESSRGSPGQWTEYQVDIGEEGNMLETVDPTWRTTCWLQLAVQGILDDEVPWYERHTFDGGNWGRSLVISQVPPHHLAVEY